MKTIVALTISLVVFAVSKARAAEQWADCAPFDVAVFDNRVHVRCSASVGGGIWYFAVPTNNTPRAARFLSLASSALVAGRPLMVLYEPTDTSGPSFGCLQHDCRPARALVMR